MNLTSIRKPEEIVTRHFGESLFAARHIFAKGEGGARVIDVGSGPGFPGIPIKILHPEISLTLIESSHRKATFLREVCRALMLDSVDVFAARAEGFPKGSGDTVILRAVEKFDSILPIAEGLLGRSGRLVLLVSERQMPRAKCLTDLTWHPSIPIPLSAARVLSIGYKSGDI
ncbi:MAG: 16S rRNA (guanine(527)-N(7))-methyltransferase RsmG [Acidobacteriota bacterium]|nr:16S rRNA (guanine(527)-N(7))-methyltransferase RsmG [Acidobacteriota bacterium]